MCLSLLQLSNWVRYCLFCTLVFFDVGVAVSKKRPLGCRTSVICDLLLRRTWYYVQNAIAVLVPSAQYESGVLQDITKNNFALNRATSNIILFSKCLF